MKKILFIIIITLSKVINAQTVSLEFMAQCRADPSVCVENVEYVKDINNLLNKYVGTWKGTFDGKNYEFNFIKKENVERGSSGIRWDRLIGRVKITDQNGIVEYDNFNKPDSEANLGDNFYKDLTVYLTIFSGAKVGCIDYGYLNLRIKPETPNNMTISFVPDNDIVKQDCTNFQTTIPTSVKINLTKQ
ncbi:hypothetical protein LF887_11980 [Chryseobacterium sp. MEBOG06]|uniref:DUF6705 family protein n=1 Tax=Chryseobacterium sp. MEBOG06 TaxID=2879938 RepID=UPI001F31CAC2|nr:DUF6705 family protein [Chryseobacterium sp. MEBOG06]UKB86314.1 hypothetical protein LF887_11980 [Chryseobacterium sp. MEBOG06]